MTEESYHQTIKGGYHPPEPKEEKVCSCTICGKKLFDGDKAYGTTTGIIDAEVDGFYSDDSEPWLTVACEECGKKISEAIHKLSMKS